MIGIVASRLKERFHRPVIAFARGSDGEIKGSGRSIPGLHLRDALDLVAKRHPGLDAQVRRSRRGGRHDAARTRFRRLPRGVRDDGAPLVSPADLERQIETDGSLGPRGDVRPRPGDRGGRVGPGFPEPQFFDAFDVVEQRVVGGRHSS